MKSDVSVVFCPSGGEFGYFLCFLEGFVGLLRRSVEEVVPELGVDDWELSLS